MSESLRRLTRRQGNDLSKASKDKSSKSSTIAQNDFKSRKNWLQSCGSNAFGQIGGGELMYSKFEITNTQITPTAISCGSTFSTIVDEEDNLYIWGSGLPGPQYKIPTQINFRSVKQVSCGKAHAAVITTEGKAFTWGYGENGVLGHGSKQNVLSPKLVSALSHFICSQITCGASHTGFIVGSEDDGLRYIRIPSYRKKSILSPIREGGEEDEDDVEKNEQILDDDEFLVCGTLYMCGLGKVGQLGMGNIRSPLMVPKEVTFFNENGLKIAKVSAGLHHTLVLAVPVHAVRTFITSIFSFGWGEDGRLGLGDEDQRMTPCEVSFQEPFHAIDISAGDMHSLALSVSSCYSWGCNEFGQLGIGSPVTTPMALSPQLIPLPEGMEVMRIRAGGRHSAAITYCDRVLTWGWGEEGQLGQGSEQSCGLPRPCRTVRVEGINGIFRDISLGMCHTVLLINNPEYRPPKPPTPEPDPVVYVPPPPVVTYDVVEEEPKSVVIYPEPEPVGTEPEPLVTEPEPVVTEPEPVVTEPEPVQVLPLEKVDISHIEERFRAGGLLLGEEDDEDEGSVMFVTASAPIVSIKDLLNSSRASSRESRRPSEDADVVRELAAAAVEEVKEFNASAREVVNSTEDDGENDAVVTSVGEDVSPEDAIRPTTSGPENTAKRADIRKAKAVVPPKDQSVSSRSNKTTFQIQSTTTPPVAVKRRPVDAPLPPSTNAKKTTSGVIVAKKK